jgi:hypothetical protein
VNLEKLEDMVRRLGRDGTVAVADLVDAQTEQVLLLLGVTGEESEDDVERLSADEGKSVVGQDLI